MSMASDRGPSAHLSDFSLEADIPHSDIAVLGDHLYAFNRERTGRGDGKWLLVTNRDANGALRAGLFGWTWAGWMKVNYLSIAEPHRRQGWGRSMLSIAEDEARRRGCARAHLTTYSFQAPGFYEKLGYRIQHVFEGLPEGHSQLTLVKELVPR